MKQFVGRAVTGGLFQSHDGMPVGTFVIQGSQLLRYAVMNGRDVLRV